MKSTGEKLSGNMRLLIYKMSLEYTREIAVATTKNEEI